MGPGVSWGLHNDAVLMVFTFSIPVKPRAALENRAAEKDHNALLESVVDVTGQDELQVIGSIDDVPGQEEAIYSTWTVGT